MELLETLGVVEPNNPNYQKSPTTQEEMCKNMEIVLKAAEQRGIDVSKYNAIGI